MPRTRTHVITFFENQDGAGNRQPTAALADTFSPLWKVASNADKLVADPKLRFLVAAHCHVDNTVEPRAVISAPSMKTRYRGRTELDIPLLSATAEPASPAVINDWRSNPIELDSTDELLYETLNNPAAAVDQFGVFIVAEGPVTPVDPRGGFWVRCTTAAAALTANGWSSRALTLAEALVKGRYECLGGRVITPSGIIARLNFPLGDHAHPPIACNDDMGDLVHPVLQPGGLGVLGEFDHDALPTLELLADSNENQVQNVYLYVRPMSGAR